MAVYEAMCQVSGELLLSPISLMKQIGDIAVECATTSGSGVVAQISNKLVGVTTNFLPTLMSLGYALAICFFIIQLIELTMSERLTLELFIKSFAKLAIGIGLVGYSKDLYPLFIQFGDAFTTFVSKAPYNINDAIGTNQYDLVTAMRTICESDGKLLWIMFLAIGIIVGCVSLFFAAILIGVVYVICLSRIIELNIRGCLLPIAFALLADDGWRGAGGRYIRKFLAVACQGAVLVLIGKITGGCIAIAANTVFAAQTNTMTTLTELLTTVLIAITTMIGVGFASVSAMFKSNQIISDAFGA